MIYWVIGIATIIVLGAVRELRRLIQMEAEDARFRHDTVMEELRVTQNMNRNLRTALERANLIEK